MTSLHVEPLTWLAAPLGGENPQATFRDPAPDMPVVAKDSLPRQFAATIGKGCGRRVLPYRLQDRYGRERKPREFAAVILENDKLKATFLPELGGRLISLIHKANNREMLYNNPVFQPANLSLRDAWFAGGIEWNIGQFGHAYHTYSPIFAAAIPGLSGSRALRLYNFERCKGGLLWQIDFHLPPGADYLYAFTRVINPRKEPLDMYWWSNVAVPEPSGLRVLAPADKAVYVDYSCGGAGLAYGQAKLPGLPTLGGRDGTYPANYPFTSEFFFQCKKADLPWEAALDQSGSGFIEASTQPLYSRKLFVWGMHQGGSHWKDFLSNPGAAYIEIQAGLAPSQQHTVRMAGNSQKCWTQAFGLVKADSAKVHGADWTTAWQAVDGELKRSLTAEALQDIQKQCGPLADAAPEALLYTGSGWGALEAIRRRVKMEPIQFPKAFAFPEATLGEEQQRWMRLLYRGDFPEQAPSAVPGEWMIQPEWQALLEQSVVEDRGDAGRHGGRPSMSLPGVDASGGPGSVPAAGHCRVEKRSSNWFALLHLGVMRMESFDMEGAKAAWEESLALAPSPWAHRNLAVLAQRCLQVDAALEHYRKAWALASVTGTPDVSFAIEALFAMLDAGQVDEAWRFHEALPAGLRGVDAIRLAAAKIAFARGDMATVEAALDADYASIREGARDLTELWFGFQAKKLAAAKGLSDDDALQEARASCPPPYRIDFRVVV